MGIMSDTPFIKFWPSDFLGGTSGLSPAERGVYITLLCLIYEANGPIARDDVRLSRRCGSPKASFKKVLDALIDQEKFIEIDGMLMNERARKALIDRTNRTQNSTHAANQRWSAQEQKSEENQCQEDAAAMPPQCAADASQSQSQNPEPDKNIVTSNEVTRASPGKSSSGYSDEFETFWRHYPEKAGKKPASKAFTKARKSISLEGMLQALERYIEVCHAKRRPYCHAATWLNQERWNDEETPLDRRPGQNMRGATIVTDGDWNDDTQTIDHEDHHNLVGSSADRNGSAGALIHGGNQGDPW